MGGQILRTPSSLDEPDGGRHTVVAAVGALVVLAVLLVAHWLYRLRSEAIHWDRAAEIYSQAIEKRGDTWHVAIESLIDRPAVQVWEALKQPERSSEFIDSFRRSELREESENRKVVRLAAQVLTLPPITIDAEFRFDDDHLRAAMRSLGNPPQTFDTTYEVVPAPDGTKALVRYSGEITNRVHLPLSDSVQKGAIQELFVKTMRALRAGIEATERQAREAAFAWGHPPEVEAETIDHQGQEWKVTFRSRVEASVERVWRALGDPREWPRSSQALQAVDVESDGPAKKIVRLKVRLLSLPPQVSKAEIDYDDAAKAARIHARGRLQDLDATYRLEPASDGGTVVRYEGVATDRVAFTLPDDVQRAAIRQLYAETIRSLTRLSTSGQG